MYTYVCIYTGDAWSDILRQIAAGSSPRTAPQRDIESIDEEEKQISLSALLAGLRDAGMNREDAREVRASPCT
jgi:hypothetical protein